jgi:hypothetical protein
MVGSAPGPGPPGAGYPSDGTWLGFVRVSQPQRGHTGGVLAPAMAHRWGSRRGYSTPATSR